MTNDCILNDSHLLSIFFCLYDKKSKMLEIRSLVMTILYIRGQQDDEEEEEQEESSDEDFQGF